jgi:hypothetical protein
MNTSRRGIVSCFSCNSHSHISNVYLQVLSKAINVTESNTIMTGKTRYNVPPRYTHVAVLFLKVDLFVTCTKTKFIEEIGRSSFQNE